jgi:hypothetical protein
MAWNNGVHRYARSIVTDMIRYVKKKPTDDGALRALATAITPWFESFKKCEADESFSQCVAEGRMSVRSVNNYNKVVTFNVSNMQAVTTKMNLDTGVLGIWARVRNSPGRFTLKYEKGLHTLSASVLRPGRSISGQLFMKDHAYIVFMPIPPVEELVLQSKLSELTHVVNEDTHTCGPNFFLYSKIREVRANMTRIHLAANRDMQTGYLNLSTGSKARIKYGYSIGIWNDTPREQHMIDKYRTQALDYTQQLGDIVGKFNEVTIKYRNHAGNFPLIADKQEATSAEQYSWKENPVMSFSGVRTIHDNGTMTRGV